MYNKSRSLHFTQGFYCDLKQEAQLPLRNFELDLVKSSWKRESEIENSFLRCETTHSHPLQLRVTHCQPKITTQVKETHQHLHRSLQQLSENSDGFYTDPTPLFSLCCKKISCYIKIVAFVLISVQWQHFRPRCMCIVMIPPMAGPLICVTSDD